MSSQKEIPRHSDRVIIIGAGVFGLTTALELKKRGYKDVTVLDRHEPPVPDGSSVDISRNIRPDYADPLYAGMALEAIEKWPSEHGVAFHKSGMLLVARARSHPYIERCKENLTGLGRPFYPFNSADELQRRYSISMSPGRVGEMEISGYENPSCGWVNAEAAMRNLVDQCREAGVRFTCGADGTATSLIRSEGRVKAIKTSSGHIIRCEWVILATGAWSSHLVDLGGTATATGQPIGFIQLSKQEAQELQSLPVTMDLTTGITIFPPSDDHILKIMRHGNGYETTFAPSHAGTDNDSSHRASGSSAPRLSYTGVSNFIPDEADAALRDGLAVFLPHLKDRPWLKRRLCWYMDTMDSNFVIDYHPELRNLLLALGGSGHGFKFLPVLGRHIANGFEKCLTDAQKERWGFKYKRNLVAKGDGSRGGPPRRLLTAQEQAKL